MLKVCSGWDILEVYNSGLTYRVVEEYIDPEPIKGNYPGITQKIYVIELLSVAYTIEDYIAVNELTKEQRAWIEKNTPVPLIGVWDEVNYKYLGVRGRV